MTISNQSGTRVSKPAVPKQSVNHYVDLDSNGNFYALNILMNSELVKARYLLRELQQKRPVIAFNKYYNRAMIITGAQVHFTDEQAVIKKLYIRDPEAKFNSQNGRRVVDSPKKFLEQIEAHWYVNTQLLDIPSHYNQIIAF